MTAKTQFLKKLQGRQLAPGSFVSKSQADIAEFTQRMDRLREEMAAWLQDTGIDTETTAESLTDLLVGQQPFTVPGIAVRYETQTLHFRPLYLYGHGVTGCVEVILCAEGKRTALQRLFMRAGARAGWVYKPGGEAGPERQFDEEAFFGLLTHLLP